MFNKLFSVLSSLFLFFAIVMPTFAADSPMTAPTQNVQSQGSSALMVAPQPAMPTVNAQNFLGQWTLDLYGGNRVDMSGAVTSLPWSDMHITLQGVQMNPDGSMFFSGVVDNEDGSSVSIYYNPAMEKRHVDMYLYIPNMEFGTTNQFMAIQCSVFITPSGDYLYGTMSAKQMNLGRNGTWVTRSDFISKLDGYHTPIQSAPTIGGKG